VILGLGIDLVRVSTFADQLSDQASRFAEATFTAAELEYSHAAPSREPARHLSARYAAKEAALKAFDTACASAGVPAPRVELSDIEVVRDQAGRPRLTFHHSASALAATLRVDRALLALTHDGDYAAAFVTLERLP